jgi:hypothetical protein
MAMKKAKESTINIKNICNRFNERTLWPIAIFIIGDLSSPAQY